MRRFCGTGFRVYGREERRYLEIRKQTVTTTNIQPTWYLDRNISYLKSTLLLSTRMGFVVDLGQLGSSQLSVALRGRESLVAKKLLNRP